MGADPQRDPLAFAVDELIPRCRGGSAIDDTNLMPAHRHCNGSRHNHPMVPDDPGWLDRKHEPQEVRERCRTGIERILYARTPTIRGW